MNRNPVEKFYDQKYHKYVHPNPSTLLEHLYVKLKKHELHRNAAAVQLLSTGRSILDVGVGFGDLLLKAKKIGYSKLYGIDVSPTVISHCKSVLQKEEVTAELSVQSIDQKTSFRKNTFDAVTIIAVFEHIFDPHQVLQELNRVLKQNGQLIIEVPNIAFFPRRISFLLGKLPKTSDEPVYEDGHLQNFTHQSLKELLESHGFSVVYRGCSGIGWKFRNIYPELLGANIVMKAIKSDEN